MKHSIFIVMFCLFFTSFNQHDSKHNTKIKKNLASSILYVRNITPATTITSVTIARTFPSRSSYTYNTSIAPNNTESFNLGNTDADVTITLGLSGYISGSLEDVATYSGDPYECPWLVCDHFSSSIAPSTSFHFYGVNHLKTLVLSIAVINLCLH